MTDLIKEQRARAWIVVLGVAALAFAFGVFLLALASCREPVEPGPMQPATCEAACAAAIALLVYVAHALERAIDDYQHRAPRPCVEARP